PVEQSNFTGSKYALIIGINYYFHKYSQQSNINSAHTFRTLVTTQYGYPESNVTLLSDDQSDPHAKPTKANIINSIRKLVKGLRPNDSVFFYFCGFSRLPVQLTTEKSKVLGDIRRICGDYILPSDFEREGAIESSYLHRKFVRQLPKSTRLTAVMNCPLGDTGFEVPYKY
ncbi:hypothetical protein GQ54DRAFT_240160, partial [Martensiomyces pterosporus]